MKKNALLILSLLTVVFSGCSDDDTTTTEAFAVAFANPATNITSDETTFSVNFSRAATTNGTVTLDVLANDVTYGTDFTTNPIVADGTIVVPFQTGDVAASIIFTKLTDANEGEVKNVKFTIASVSIDAVIAPSTSATTLNYNETAIESNTLVSNNGGNTVPNQVYIDLSSGLSTEILKTSWDLGFYSGNEFRVTINGAINKLSVKQLNTTNIDEVQSEDPNVTTGNYEASNMAYVDAPYGNLSGTAIAAISENDADNKVYLVNMGTNISDAPGTGTGIALNGNARGWKKIRILRSGSNYKLQIADLAATTHTEIIIQKTPTHNFTFFSLVSNTVVSAEPQKDKWDINLTTFTGETFYGSGESAGAYYFPDYAITNTKAGTRAIQILVSDVSYESFTMANINSGDFQNNTAADQQAIGGNWRATYPLQLKTDRFFVIKDVAGNYYKLKFLSMLDAQSQRGKITFEYSLL